MTVREYEGMTGDDYDRLLEAQGGGCAICGRFPKSKRLATDHDHKTGELRGLLCYLCNYHLVRDHTDWRLLQNAADYLKRPPALKLFETPFVHKKHLSSKGE